MNWGVWLVAGCLAAIGLAGTIIPFLPGHLLIVGAGLVPFFSLEDQGGVSLWGVALLVTGLVVAQLLEFLSGAMGSRWFGGTRWGAFGAITGGIIGIFFFPIGLLLGPLLGAFVSEWLFANQAFRPATKSGIGSAVGTLSGMAIKVVVAVVMVAILAVDIFWL